MYRFPCSVWAIHLVSNVRGQSTNSCADTKAKHLDNCFLFCSVVCYCSLLPFLHQFFCGFCCVSSFQKLFQTRPTQDMFKILQSCFRPRLRRLQSENFLFVSSNRVLNGTQAGRSGLPGDGLFSFISETVAGELRNLIVSMSRKRTEIALMLVIHWRCDEGLFALKEVRVAVTDVFWPFVRMNKRWTKGRIQLLFTETY